jgi:putative membrane protein insertion efficiency factor
MKFIALKLLRFYKKYISPGLPPSCRFEPTCSVYSYQAIEKYGFWRGSRMTISRLLRCQPFYKGSLYDPVP